MSAVQVAEYSIDGNEVKSRVVSRCLVTSKSIISMLFVEPAFVKASVRSEPLATKHVASLVCKQDHTE